MRVIKRLALAPVILFFAVWCSCSARIDGTLKEGGAGELLLKTSLEPRTLALIRSLKGFLGDKADRPVLDGPSITRSMAAAPGIRSVDLKNTSPSALDGSISITNAEDFLAAPERRFITYTEGETSSVTISLSMDSAPGIISRLSPEASEYLSALMAPAALGERSSKQEYFDIVSMVYGRPLAEEIAAARVRAFIEFPRPVKAVSGGAASGNRAEFDIPLIDILVLEQPLRYEVLW